ncbi:MAG: discoidin domain-containing protein, partial [Phycisphaerae bacterium]
MSRSPRVNLFVVAAGLGLALASCAAVSRAARAQPFTSHWPEGITRVWVGREFWANPMQDWRVADGRLECVVSGGDRNVHLLTRQLGEGEGDLAMRVRLGAIGDPKKLTDGWVGFRVGVLGYWKEYRDSLRRGKGLDAGVTTDGHLFIGSARQAGGGEALGIPRKKWKVHHVDSQETTGGTDARAENVFDGRPGTIWHNEWKEKKTPYPHEIQIDLGAAHQVTGFAVLPRQEQSVGRIKAYACYVSADGKAWGEPVAEGEFKNTKDLQRVACEPKEGRYVRLLARSGIMDRPACAVAELYVFDPKHPGKAEAPAPGPVPLNEVDLLLSAAPQGDAYRLTLAAHDPESHEQLAEVSRKVKPDGLVGNLALVCYAGTNGQNRRGNVRFWFRNWHVEGSKVEAHPDHAFGPI